MQLVDRNGVTEMVSFGILFQTTTEPHFILNLRVLAVLNANSKELYWKLITTTEHMPTLQKNP